MTTFRALAAWDPSEQSRPDVLEEAMRDLEAAQLDTFASLSQEQGRAVQITISAANSEHSRVLATLRGALIK
jgi:hypothetical protein